MSRRWRIWLAGAAALAGVLAPLAGSPHRRASGRLADGRVSDGRSSDSVSGPLAGRAVGSVDVAELARIVAAEDDHVSAVELAAWLRARRRGLRVLDLRTATEYAAYHIPGAEHLPLEQLASARFAPDDTLVLYSELGVHAGQAWVLLRALGHPHVVFLRAGLREWLDDVMSPTIAADAPAEAQAAFDRVAELSRWFGGTPRRLPGAGDAATETASAPARSIARRGC